MRGYRRLEMKPVILVVEDDPQLRNGMRTLLQGQGYLVHAAATLAEARAQLDAAAPTHVISDLNLPDGLGTELLRVVQSRGDATRFMFVTGSAGSPALTEAGHLGVDNMMTKPPDWDFIAKWAGAV